MITTCIISLTVTIPGEGLTGSHQCISSESIVDSEFQSYSILATLRICKYVVMITTCIISLTVTIPGEGLTSCYQCIGPESIVNGKFQSYSILATLRIRKYVVMIACGCIGLPITVPCKGLTSGYQCIGSDTIVDSKFLS